LDSNNKPSVQESVEFTLEFSVINKGKIIAKYVMAILKFENALVELESKKIVLCELDEVENIFKVGPYTGSGTPVVVPPEPSNFRTDSTKMGLTSGLPKIELNIEFEDNSKPVIINYCLTHEELPTTQGVLKFTYDPSNRTVELEEEEKEVY